MEAFTETPEFENSTEHYSYGSYAERQLLSAVIFIACFIGMVGNGIVIYLVLTVKKLQTVTNVFVANLAVADTMTCVAALGQGTVVLSHELIIPEWLCTCVAFGLLTFIGCSVNTLTLIAVNRLIAVTDTARIRYRKIYTRPKIVVMVVVAWFIPAFVALIPIFSDYAELGFDAYFGSCTWRSAPVDGIIYSLFVAGVFYPLQLTIVLASYIRIFFFVRSSTRSVMKPGKSDGPQTNLQKQLSKRQLDVTKNLFMVVCVFLLCLFPYFLVLALDSLAYNVLPYAATILLANSCLNPVIYGTKHPDFRVEFARIFNTCFGKCRGSKKAKPSKHGGQSTSSGTGKGSTSATHTTRL